MIYLGSNLIRAILKESNLMPLISISVGVDTLNFAAWVDNFSVELASSSFRFSPKILWENSNEPFGQPSS